MRDMVARRMGRLLGEVIFEPQVEVVVDRLCTAFARTPFAVALAEHKVLWLPLRGLAVAL